MQFPGERGTPWIPAVDAEPGRSCFLMAWADWRREKPLGGAPAMREEVLP